MANNTHSLDLELSSTQYASIADGSQTGLDIASDFTFETWIKLEQLSSTAGANFQMIAKYDSAGDQRAYHFHLRSDTNKMQIFFDSVGDGVAGNITNAISDTAITTIGSWVHIAVVVDISGPTVTFYKNTVADTTTYEQQNATTLKNSSAAFEIGARDGATTFDGKLNNVRVWSDIRTSGEIAANWKTVLTTEGNLVGSWYANDNHNDLTSNNNDLTASGSPVFSTDVPFGISGNPMFFSPQLAIG